MPCTVMGGTYADKLVRLRGVIDTESVFGLVALGKNKIPTVQTESIPWVDL